MSQIPGKYSIHKSKSAAQFSLRYPTWKNSSGNEYIDREGVVLIELAPFDKEINGNKTYKWSEKIIFGLGIADICRLMSDIHKPLIHTSKDNGEDVTKKLVFQDGRDPGGMMMFLTQTGGSNPRNYGVYLDKGEFVVLKMLLSSATPKLIGW